MKKIGIIISSVRESRIGESVANHIASLAAKEKDSQYQIIDLKAINLPLLNEPYPAVMGNYQYSHTKEWSNLISSYDGFILVTAEYNHGYPAAIKNALDYLYTEWHNKPMTFVGYGYSANGARAIEQLRQVVAYLQLKPLWKDVVINLGTNSKDGIFQSSENIDKQLNGMIFDLESSFG